MDNAFQWTELALTLGSWGASPPGEDDVRQVMETLADWCAGNGAIVRLEVYAESETDRAALRHLCSLQEKGMPVRPLVRLQPRSDRFEMAAAEGVREVVFEVPAGPVSAGERFLSGGISRSASYAREQALSAALAGLVPEIALTDITRADQSDVLEIVHAVERVLRARGIQPLWRLVDSLGLGLPLADANPPRSLEKWVNFLQESCRVPVARISVQAADTLGLGLADTLNGLQTGATGATTLFGLGMGAGWAASELVLLHSLFTWPRLTSLIELKELLDPRGIRRDLCRPLNGRNAFQTLVGASPEKIEDKIGERFPFDPREITGQKLEPLLTGLSGHAGLLHLIHRHNPHLRLDSEDPEIKELSTKYEEQFRSGRQQPLSWEEVSPLIRER